MIVIVDYGMGNLGSIENMFKKIGISAIISSDLNIISKGSKIVLPGVGSFDSAMKKISSSGLLNVLNDKALVEKVPVLGICLGMQLLTNSSEEGTHSGLKWIDAETLSFKGRVNESLKIPHMGWNSVNFHSSNTILQDYEMDVKFYFVHSYFVKVKNESNSLMSTNYGLSFDSAIVRENIFGVQFHPEKSLKNGMQILKNFSEM